MSNDTEVSINFLAHRNKWHVNGLHVLAHLLLFYFPFLLSKHIIKVFLINFNNLQEAIYLMCFKNQEQLLICLRYNPSQRIFSPLQYLIVQVNLWFCVDSFSLQFSFPF